MAKAHRADGQGEVQPTAEHGCAGRSFHWPSSRIWAANRWGMRFVLGPWRSMLVIYEYRETEDRAVVLTIQNARACTAATSE